MYVQLTLNDLKNRGIKMQSTIDRKQFADLLYKVQYSSFSDSENVRNLLIPIREWIKANIPTKLYRFRQINKYSMNAFENDEVWGSIINTFNDPYECLPCYDMDEINAQIEREFSMESLKSNLRQISSNDISDWMTDLYDISIISTLRESAEQLVSQDLTCCLLIKNLIIQYCNSNMENLKLRFIEEILMRENQYHVASFSESYRSTLMWAHYAKSHTGFCLEYDFKSILRDCDESCESICSCPGFMLNYCIAPINYCEKRYDASAGFMSAIVNWLIDDLKIKMNNIYYDMFLPTKTMLTKNDVWEYEREWRLFKPCLSSKYLQHNLIAHIKPRAVYLGAKIKTYNKQRIINICKVKKIACYQMLPQYFTCDYECEPYQLI